MASPKRTHTEVIEITSPVHVEWSREMQRIKPPTPRECYGNSIRCMGFVAEQVCGPDVKILYTEGHAVAADGLPINFEHGWLTAVCADGKRWVIECTLNPEITVHFAGAHWDMGQVVAALTCGDNGLPLMFFAHDWGWGAGEHAPMRAAIDAAHKHVYGHTLTEMIAMLDAARDGQQQDEASRRAVRAVAIEVAKREVYDGGL